MNQKSPVAVVTGGARGIGRGIALVLGEAGVTAMLLIAKPEIIKYRNCHHGYSARSPCA